MDLGTRVAILSIVVPLTASLLGFMLRSFVDDRVNQALKSIRAELDIKSSQIAQLQNRVALIQNNLGEDPDTFIRGRYE